MAGISRVPGRDHRHIPLFPDLVARYRSGAPELGGGGWSWAEL